MATASTSTQARRFNLRKVGLAVGLISATEWLVISTSFLSRYLLQFYQTSIGYATGRFGMDASETGIAFALFGVAFGLAAFLVHRLPPARLKVAVAVCLVALGATMPLYLVAHGTVEVDLLMVFDGLLTGIYMDALMTMAGMASLDPRQRQVDQAGFSFWVSTSLIVAPFTTGLLIRVLGIKDMFTLFAIMAGVAALLVLTLRGDHDLKYVGHRSSDGAERGPSELAFLFRNKNAIFNASLIAAIGNKVPYFIVLSFAVLYGKTLGLSAREIFYLMAVMFVFNVGARFVVMVLSPISNKVAVMVTAMAFATAAAIALALTPEVHDLFYLVFPLAGIPEGMLWPIGLQVANTTFKAHQVASSRAFFSSGMMIMAACMPVVGLLATSASYSASFWAFAGVVVVAFALLAYVRAHGLLRAPGTGAAAGAGPRAVPAPSGTPQDQPAAKATAEAVTSQVDQLHVTSLGPSAGSGEAAN
ncbi:MAG: MFS transporter [Acidimicrobiales bacterium]